jgi:hypothetical protein
MTAMHVSIARPSRLDAQRLVHRLRVVARDARRHSPDPVAFVFVTPLGLERRLELQRALRRLGILVKHRCPIRDWGHVASSLYVKRATVPRLLKAVAYERIWRRLFPEGLAEAWGLSASSYLRVLGAKAWLRTRFQSVPVLAGADGMLRLHCFHLPDPEDVDRETSLFRAAVRFGSGPAGS